MVGPYEINPLKITEWAISRIQNGPFAQNLDFSRGPRLFWPQNCPRYRSCHLQGQKSLRPLEKSRFFAQGPFRILEMAHLVIFSRVDFIRSLHIYSTGKVHSFQQCLNVQVHSLHQCVNVQISSFQPCTSTYKCSGTRPATLCCWRVKHLHWLLPTALLPSTR